MNPSNSKRPILVTGSHRSGTTWVGKMISASPEIGYIREPFNIEHNPGICGTKFVYWFTYITDDNGGIFYENLKKTLEFKYSFIRGFKRNSSIKNLKSTLKEYITFLMYRSRGVRPLIKDPIAIFSADWFAKVFDMDVVVLIRHPAAFAYSLKRMNWTHPFSNFLEQPLLIRDHLFSFEAEIRECASNKYDIIDQAILLWRLIHHMIIKYKKNHYDWIFIRHEDLSRDPLGGFQSLFKKLNIEFSEHIREVIEEYSNPENPSEPPKGGQSLKRDSRSNIWNWKKRLTTLEINRIRTRVEDISKDFYSDEDW